jgi:hypothetical protein
MEWSTKPKLEKSLTTLFDLPPHPQRRGFEVSGRTRSRPRVLSARRLPVGQPRTYPNCP